MFCGLVCKSGEFLALWQRASRWPVFHADDRALLSCFHASLQPKYCFWESSFQGVFQPGLMTHVYCIKGGGERCSLSYASVSFGLVSGSSNSTCFIVIAPFPLCRTTPVSSAIQLAGPYKLLQNAWQWLTGQANNFPLKLGGEFSPFLEKLNHL